MTGEFYHQNQQDQDNEDDHGHLHPAWDAKGRFTVEPHAGAEVFGRGSHGCARIARASEDYFFHGAIFLFLFMIERASGAEKE
jgi:hypothetical protein